MQWGEGGLPGGESLLKVYALKEVRVRARDAVWRRPGSRRCPADWVLGPFG